MTTQVRRVYNPERAMAHFDKLNSLVNLVAGAVNSVATNAMTDAVFMLKKTHYYRHAIKHHIKQAMADYERWEHVNTKKFGERYNLFIDYLSTAEEEIQPHIDILYYSIKNAMDKQKLDHSDIKARVELVRTLLEYACFMYDTLIKTCLESTGLNFDKLMRPARLTTALHHWTIVESHICKCTTNIDLNKDPKCRMAFNIIEKKLTSEDFINRAGFLALQKNPGCRKYVSDEDYALLEASVS